MNELMETFELRQRGPLGRGAAVAAWTGANVLPLSSFSLLPFCESFPSLEAGAERIARRRYGVIEARAGRVTRITLRPLPTLFSLRELWPLGDHWRPSGQSDRVRLYYNQPRGHSKFLALRYVAATPGTRYATLLAALRALDGVACLKQSDALLCDAANRRLSDRFLARMGWVSHAPGWRQRNFIKRFYGHYPAWAAAPA